MFDLLDHNQTKKTAGGKAGSADSALGGKDMPSENPLWQSLALRPPFIQPKPTANRGPGSHEQGADVDEALRSPGQPLDSATRAYMELRFGHDFSPVRVHSDAPAAASARGLGARAFTLGRDIALAPHAYGSGSRSEPWLLAPELAQ